MNAFQWLLVAFCLLQAALAAVRYRRGYAPIDLGFLLVWLAGAALALHPAVTSAAARALGIDRGVDLMFYVLCVAFVWAHYQHYLRYRRIEEQLTLVVRELALLRPQSPEGREPAEAA